MGMRRSQRRNNLQIWPRRDSNTGGSDMWSNTLPLDHGSLRFIIIIIITNISTRLVLEEVLIVVVYSPFSFLIQTRFNVDVLLNRICLPMLKQVCIR